jgi:hypothetical protein
MWLRIARKFDMEVADSVPISLASYMADKELLSQEMTRKHRLTPIFYDRLVSWAFGDFIFHSTFDDVSSTIKARRVGFHECIDTEGMFIELFSELRENRVIPPLV